MNITQAIPTPFLGLKYSRVKARSKGAIEQVHLPFYDVFVDALPSGLDALICTSDLQGLAVRTSGEKRVRGKPDLLGFAVVEKTLSILAQRNLDPARVGIVLAGDFHCDAQLRYRGGYGDVSGVWSAFHETFRWVIGVAGNHDTFNGHANPDAFKGIKDCHLLNGNTIAKGGVRFGGVSGVLGSSDKPWRHPQEKQFQLIDRAFAGKPDWMIIHEGPSVQEHGLEGKDCIRAHLETHQPTWLLCGHRNWPNNAVYSLSNGTRVMSLDGKVLVFSQEK